MYYPQSSTPYIQNAMAQAIQAVMTGHSLPPNCFVMTIPIQQAQHMFPQLMGNYGSANGQVGFPQQPPYYGQQHQPQLGPYQQTHKQQQQQQPTVPGPYLNHYSQGYNPNTNYPVVPYSDQPKPKGRHDKKDRSGPHPNIYNSSSFDSEMNELSWSRLFGHPQTKASSNQAPGASDAKTKANIRTNHSSTSSSSSISSTEEGSSTTISDETIRRVNVANKQSAGSSSSKQQTKGTLPFKYSSEFIPGNGKSQPQRDSQIKPDDVFVVRKPQQAQPSAPSKQ